MIRLSLWGTSIFLVLIKGFDSEPTSARFAMHTAFPLANQGENNKPRQSIETRTYAFFDV
ncbi:hypothetical protein [Psychromonas arctica]|uniref:hypothetical protein n=1 Tax=Psychromonas arctica TaxID=168275 RepID=UPI002FD50994